jgi:hypothetical protein
VALAIVQMAAAFGITPAMASATFIPGDEFVSRFTVLNDEGLPGMLRVSVEGGLSDLVTINMTEMPLEATVSIPYRITFPRQVPPGGDYVTKIFVEPVLPPELNAVGAQVRLAHRVTITVPAHGKFVTVETDASQREGVINLTAHVRNIGSDDISALSATFGFFQDAETPVWSTTTKTVSLPAGDRDVLGASLMASELPPGVYELRTSVSYDGNSTGSSQTYEHGVPSLALVNATTMVSKDDLTPFSLTVQSVWNRPLDGVYADVSVLDASGTVVRQFKTETVDIQPGEPVTYTPFFDSRGLTLDTADVIATFHLGAGAQEFRFPVQILAKEEIARRLAEAGKPQVNPQFIILVLLAVAAAIIIVIRRRRKA